MSCCPSFLIFKTSLVLYTYFIRVCFNPKVDSTQFSMISSSLFFFFFYKVIICRASTKTYKYKYNTQHDNIPVPSIWTEYHVIFNEGSCATIINLHLKNNNNEFTFYACKLWQSLWHHHVDPAAFTKLNLWQPQVSMNAVHKGQTENSQRFIAEHFYLLNINTTVYLSSSKKHYLRGKIAQKYITVTRVSRLRANSRIFPGRPDEEAAQQRPHP